MAGVSSVSNLSSLSEDLYYQYLINNNSTSTMLNAISGNDDNTSDTSGIMQAVSAGLSSSLSGLTGMDSLLGLTGLSGSDESLLETSQALSNFSDILQTYMSAQTAEAATMADSLSSVLEEASESEDTSGLTYRTVQEIYQYFLEKSSSADQGISSSASRLQSAVSGGVSTGSGAIDPQQISEMDFESLEEELQQQAEAAIAVPF